MQYFVTAGDHPEFNDPDSMRTKVFAVWNILFDLVFFIICSLLILFFNIGVRPYFVIFSRTHLARARIRSTQNPSPVGRRQVANKGAAPRGRPTHQRARKLSKSVT